MIECSVAYFCTTVIYLFWYGNRGTLMLIVMMGMAISNGIHLCRLLSFYFFIYILQLIQSLPLTFSLSTRPYLSDFVDDYAVHCCAVQPLRQPQLLRQVHSHYVSLVYTVPRCWIENWKISYSWHIWNWNGTIKAVMCFFVSVCMWLAEWGYRNIWFALIWKQKGIGWHPINCACACVCMWFYTSIENELSFHIFLMAQWQ